MYIYIVICIYIYIFIYLYVCVYIYGRNGNGGGRWHSGKDCPPLPSEGRVCPPSLFGCHGPWHWDLALAWWRRSLHRSSVPARNSNSGASYVAVLSRPAGLPGVSVLSESATAKYYQLQLVQRDADACTVAVIASWWTKLWRTSRDLKDIDKLGIELETSLAVITPPGRFGRYDYTGAHGGPQPTKCGCRLYLAPFPHFCQQGWLAQPSPTTLSPFDPTSYGLSNDCL